MKKNNFYKKFITKVKCLTKARKLPKSFSKRKNNVFSIAKHMTMNVLMQREEKTYREMPDLLELLKDEIGLKRIPHFTTMNKFAKRAKPNWFYVLNEQIIKEICTEECICAIDGTGFSLSCRSKYFETIAGTRNAFLQLNACYENKHHLIVDCKIHLKRVHENKDFQKIARKTAKQVKASCFLADKAYDSEDNHKFVRYELKSKFVSPLRRHGKKITGFYRRQMEDLPLIYKKRASIAETGNSAIKGRYGDMIRSKKFRMQKNELLGKILAYNIERIICLNAITFYSPPHFVCFITRKI